MAEEAFALSPISARAAQPSEEDYAAISEAFMETSRGRWFLGEYAKRNRNADTRMVLDAVARIEESLSAQRQAAADAFRDEQLEQALTALRGAVEAVQASAIAALDELSFEQSLAPIRKGVRVIREISWRLREIGNDGRICDIMDSQASAIEAGASQVSIDEAKTVVDAAFAALTRRLAEFNAEEAAAPATEPAVAEAAVAEAPAASPAGAAESAQPQIVAAEAAPVHDVAATPSADLTTATVAQPTEHALAKAEAALAEAEAAELAHVADEAAADAHDEAVLDLIAMEMGAPDPTGDDEAMLVAEMHAAEAMAAEPDIAAPTREPELVQAPKPVPELARAPEPMLEPQPAAEARIAEAPVSLTPSQADMKTISARASDVSLGSTIIASGLVKRPSAAANDPLAPIRRMGQAEKIAFFS
ncbi:hypothetical protein MTX26_23305 [Bradyrhizobium sp. ISRA443]|uniref:hypothetical protein n=1 Tax=unclassified Bradyrhizobium TaxID=2631580 RepID=UPI00247874B0|nr:MULTISPECIES: hypothetical protein [unclassified Bradyrhizobium]WGR97346.1 hypothetical protein MTX23_23305 [Bradyrhizobium sp. ISRA436]WGS04235.1 hypothetical protein MTX18_23305 [Bradyrhizobium sp. ISRA437]WGS11118.1 hypothetical protein MTX26_23305 [Bradyrhizobium sp. ISRA443]